VNNLLDLINFLLCLLAPVLLGRLVLGAFIKFDDTFFPPEKFFIAFGLGFGIITLVMFYLSMAGVSFTSLPVISSLLFPFAAIFLFLKYKKRRRPSSSKQAFHIPKQGGPFKGLCVFLFIIIFVNALGVIIRAWLVEIDMWDSWAFWAFKAKIYYIHEIIPFDKFHEFSTVWGHWDYPHHVPLMEAWVLMWLGYWNDQWPRIIFPVFYLGLGAGIYYFLRRYTSLLMSAAGTFFVMTLNSLQIYTMSTIAESVLLFYYILSFLFLLRFEREGQWGLLVLSALFISLAAWTKNEGNAYFLFNVLNIILFLKTKNFSQKIKALLLYAAIFICIMSPWIILKNILGLENYVINEEHLSFHAIIKNISFLPDAMRAMALDLFNLDYFNLSWMIFLFFLIRNAKICLKPSYNYLLFTISLHILMISGLAVLFPEPIYLTDTMGRLLMAPTILGIIFAILVMDTSSDYKV